MRKRLIGKAFAIAMSGAMVLTATPVTANIFHVAHIVKAADEQSDEYVYCYAGLTWNEYWASEGVYAAGNDSSSDTLDSHSELDNGGYDAVTRATTNHGLHRGSFQCITTIYTTDGSAYQISNWEQVKDSDGKVTATYLHLKDVEGRVTFNKGTLTFADNSTKKMDHYSVSGIKYVPVKVKASDYNDFKAKYSVVENNGTLIGGYAEGVLSSYEASANVTADTNGLKEAVKGSDGSFSFKARTTGTDSGIKDQTLQKAVKITPTVKAASGSYGEFLRVDLNGDDYGALGDKMQAVKWTYYGNDSTRTKALASYGTKFAADNWMHKMMGIQLGLTESGRCKLPEGTDGTGYWILTVHALGYQDYVVKFQATAENIAKPAGDADSTPLENIIAEAKALNEADYTPESWAAAKDSIANELEECEEMLANIKNQTTYGVEEQIGHLREALNMLVKAPAPTATPVPAEPTATPAPVQPTATPAPTATPTPTATPGITATAKASTIYTKGKTSTTITVEKTGVTGKAKFTSSNKKVATVTSKGVVKAKKAGKTTITVKVGNYTKKVVIQVKKPSLKLAKSSATIKKGKTVKIKATATPSGKVTYKSSNKKVATVTAKGVVKGKKKGTATITVTSNGVSKKFKVKVK